MTRSRFGRTTSWLAAGALALALPRVAAAEPHKLLVLQSEGRAAAAIRAKIDSAITRLAIATELQASLGELTFSDAATAVGCSKPDAPSCKDDVLGMLAVDEIVITTVTPKPGGLEIAVQRFAKGGASRDAKVLLPTGTSPDKLDGIATLFADQLGGTAPTAASAATGSATTGSATTGSATTGSATTGSVSTGATSASAGATSAGATSAPSGAAISATQPGEPPPAIPAATPPAPQPGPAPATDSATPFDSSARDRKLELGGMIGGGSAVVVGLLLWAGASSTQTEIDAAPNRTQSDLNHLRDLESRGDFYANAGNVLVATGVLVGGIATYLYIRDRRSASAATARLTPTLLPHGAGLVLSFGGPP